MSNDQMSEAVLLQIRGLVSAATGLLQTAESFLLSEAGKPITEIPKVVIKDVALPEKPKQGKQTTGGGLDKTVREAPPKLPKPKPKEIATEAELIALTKKSIDDGMADKVVKLFRTFGIGKVQECPDEKKNELYDAIMNIIQGD